MVPVVLRTDGRPPRIARAQDDFPPSEFLAFAVPEQNEAGMPRPNEEQL
jgi:hypothetical protein